MDGPADGWTVNPKTNDLLTFCCNHIFAIEVKLSLRYSKWKGWGQKDVDEIVVRPQLLQFVLPSGCSGQLMT